MCVNVAICLYVLECWPCCCMCSSVLLMNWLFLYVRAIPWTKSPNGHCSCTSSSNKYNNNNNNFFKLIRDWLASQWFMEFLTFAQQFDWDLKSTPYLPFKHELQLLEIDTLPYFNIKVWTEKLVDLRKSPRRLVNKSGDWARNWHFPAFFLLAAGGNETKEYQNSATANK